MFNIVFSTNIHNFLENESIDLTEKHKTVQNFFLPAIKLQTLIPIELSSRITRISFVIFHRNFRSTTFKGSLMIFRKVFLISHYIFFHILSILIFLVQLSRFNIKSILSASSNIQNTCYNGQRNIRVSLSQASCKGKRWNPYFLYQN